MWTKQQAIDYALSQVGKTDGSLYFKIAFGYRSYADWCAAFDSAIKVLGKLDCPYFPDPFAFDKRDLGKIGDRWVEPYDLEAGDFISFDFDGGGQYGGDHVGIVSKKYARGDYQTVEGNCGKQVKVKHRTVKGDGIIGGIRPKYADEPSGKLVVDGVFGVNTVKALQKALQGHGYYNGYLVDGDWGYYSKRETQRYLRAKGYYGNTWLLDGWFGPASIKALQTYLRKLGYYTDAYLLDGDWGKYTTIALQKALNAGKF